MTDNQITLTDDVELMARRLHAKARGLGLTEWPWLWDARNVEFHGRNIMQRGLCDETKAKWREVAMVAMGRECSNPTALTLMPQFPSRSLMIAPPMSLVCDWEA